MSYQVLVKLFKNNIEVFKNSHSAGNFGNLKTKKQVFDSFMYSYYYGPNSVVDDLFLKQFNIPKIDDFDQVMIMFSPNDFQHFNKEEYNDL